MFCSKKSSHLLHNSFDVIYNYKQNSRLLILQLLSVIFFPACYCTNRVLHARSGRQMTRVNMHGTAIDLNAQKPVANSHAKVLK